jgi:hypothetical protein
MDLLQNTNCNELSDGSPLVSMVSIDENVKFPLNIYDIFEKYDQWSSENKYVSKITQFKTKIVWK